MTIHFMSLASGSSGNCYYLGTDSYGILIDAGISARRIKKTLKQHNIGMETIRAVFITHDHADHIKGVGMLGEKLHIPIYATQEVHKGINENYCTRIKLNGSVRYLEKQEPFHLEDFRIESFEVPHDGTDNVGYSIDIKGVNFAFLTDLGEITPMAAQYIAKSNYLILESNYDEEMLRMGTYPLYLKERIASPFGHLGNQDTADFLAKNYREDLYHVWLCHLSRDNNHPELVYKTIEYRLKAEGIQIGKDIQIEPLKRTTPSPLYLISHNGAERVICPSKESSLLEK
ncbi:MAG: MBL fold metallo-hydrolase [Bacteroidales bacterium]|nr:MBL fold metallo-hydrolase [Bacteroidales bacterium]